MAFNKGVVPASSKLLNIAGGMSGGDEGLPWWAYSLSTVVLADLRSPSSFLTAISYGEYLVIHNHMLQVDTGNLTIACLPIN